MVELAKAPVQKPTCSVIFNVRQNAVKKSCSMLSKMRGITLKTPRAVFSCIFP